MMSPFAKDVTVVDGDAEKLWIEQKFVLLKAV